MFYPIITATDIKTLIPEIGYEIDNTIITSLIERLQDMKIRPLLRSYSWYEEIMTQASGGTYSAANEIIVNDYIKLILAFFVQQKIIITQTYHIERAGLRIKTFDVSEVAQPEDIRFYIQTITDEIDYLKGEFFKYLTENEASYPLYQSDTDPRTATHSQGRQIANYGVNISRIGRNYYPKDHVDDDDYLIR
jgi:hypothetical protein